MSPYRSILASVALLAGLLIAPAPARAAQSLDTCAGFIDSLPATISTQGVWCLRHDLSTAITSGSAIIIASNNVTIDCNDFKLGGLAAGAGTQAYGIYAYSRLNATVRHCNIRGFYYGMYFLGYAGGGHVVEDNRFDGNTYIGLRIDGDGSVVRRNQVNDTGGSTALSGSAYGILTVNSVDILDNVVGGVLPTASGGNGTAYGIYVSANPNGRINGNGVHGLVGLGTGKNFGIFNIVSERISMRDNDLSGDASAGIGLYCANSNGAARDNIINGFATAISNCTSSSNMVIP